MSPTPATPPESTPPSLSQVHRSGPGPRATTGALARPEGPLDVKGCIEPGTALALIGANVLAVLGCALLVLTVYGALIAIVGAIANVFLRRRARVLLRASSLRIGPRQFPEIHACATGFARRLGLDETPEMYVVDTSEVNGFALLFGRKKWSC